MLICEVCGKVNPEGSRNCDYCGAHLGSATTLPPDSAPLLLAAMPDAAMSGPVCPKCRRGNRRGAVFCIHCGFDLNKSSLPQISRPTGDGGPSRPPSGPLNYEIGSVAANVTGNLPPGMILKRRYRILRKVAQGGMGAVYESTDIEAPAGSRWAVKEISPAALPPDERRQAISDFRREAQILATLHHPNLPEVLETFEDVGKHFLVMEFVPGRTLLNVVDGTPTFIPEERVMVWARQLFDVLHYLHSQDPPIIYRDLKPANIMLVEGTERIKLIDFGIARFHKAGKAHDTEAFGTAGYAPPEQYGKGQTDQRSDIYALAATLHHLLTRHDPSLNPFNWLPIRRYSRTLSVDIENALVRALSLDSVKRFSSMADFAQAMGIPLPKSQSTQVHKPAEAPKPAIIAAPATPKPTPKPTPAPTPPPSRPTSDSLVNSEGARKQPQPVSPAKPVAMPRPQVEPPRIAPAPVAEIPIVVAPTPPIVPTPATSIQPTAPTLVAASEVIPPASSAINAQTKQPTASRPNNAQKIADIVQGTRTAIAAISEITAQVAPQLVEKAESRKQQAEFETLKSEVEGPKSEEPDLVTPTNSKLKTTPSNGVKGQNSKLEDAVLDLGVVRWNTRPVRRLALRSAAGGQMRGTVDASQPWIAYNPQQFNGNPVTLEVKVKHRELPFGRTELHVPNLFAIIWSHTRRVLPFIGLWFWIMILAGSALGRMLPWALAGVVAGVAALELLIWVWTWHVRYLVPTERLNTGRLTVKSSEGDRQIEVRAMARPSRARRAAGWTGAMVLLLAEVAAVAWIILTIAGVTVPLALPGL